MCFFAFLKWRGLCLCRVLQKAQNTCFATRERARRVLRVHGVSDTRECTREVMVYEMKVRCCLPGRQWRYGDDMVIPKAACIFSYASGDLRLKQNRAHVVCNASGNVHLLLPFLSCPSGQTHSVKNSTHLDVKIKNLHVCTHLWGKIQK